MNKLSSLICSHRYHIVRHGSHLIIQNPERYLRSPKLVSYALSKNIKGRLEWPLALAYILDLYKLHGSYILD